MTIFAVIVTFNAMRRDWLNNCLKSLLNSTVPCTPIVIDNMSTDGTRDYVPTHYPQVIWMPQEQNLGFGQANNLGIKYALQHNADYVLLLNQDARLEPSALEAMLRESDGKSLMTPSHLNGDGTKLDFMFNQSIKIAKLPLSEEEILCGNTESKYILHEVSAACWFMPRALIEEIGGFNPLFYHYGEDNNYYRRMFYHHMGDVIFVPKAIMFHDRQIHGDMKAYHKDMLRREILQMVTNINMTPFYVFRKWARLLLRCYVYDWRRQQYTPGSYTKDSFWILCRMVKIVKSRRKEKSKGLTWL